MNDDFTPAERAADWLQAAPGRPSLHRSADGGLDFGDAAAEALATLEGSAVYPLTQLATLHARGRDVDGFLQGQLSNDIAALRSERAQLTSYNSAKGRVLAVLTAVRAEDGIWLQTRAELAAALLKRLRMFVLRAQVQIEDISTAHPLIGLSGENAAAALARLGLPAPEPEWAAARQDAVRVIRCPGDRPRFTLQAPAAQLAQLWPQLTRDFRPAGPAAWRLLDLCGGLPSVVPATQDHFVAQMLNLDTLGGISFTKGCYPGQEVVARMHYLGKLKRRMFLGFSASPPSPGTPIYLAAGDTQAIGEVVDAAAHPRRGAALLAVLQTQYQDSEALRLQSPSGPQLQLAPAAPAGIP